MAAVEPLLAALLFLPPLWALGLFLAFPNDGEIWWERGPFAKHN